jgi:hypothetical protein
MDNLDRTNVAQAAIAKWILDLQMKAAGILSEKDGPDRHEEIDVALRESMEMFLCFPCSHLMLMVILQCGRSMLISSPKRMLEPVL